MEKDWVDFRAVKEAVSMQMVLDHYRVQLRKVNATTLRGKCPLPTHSSKKDAGTFAANTEKNVWACQSDSCVKARGGRKGGNVLDFVAVMESCTVRDAALKLAEWFGITSPVPGATPKEPPKSDSPGQAPAKAKPDLVAGEEKAGAGESPALGGVNAALKFQLKGVDPNHPYLAKRGIKRETAEAFGVGFFPGKGSMAGRVVVPIHNEKGELVAYAGRSVDATEPKYKLPAGFHKAGVLFNLNRVLALKARRVVVVEGFFDAMKVHQAGFRAVVALMGSSVSREQEQLLQENFSQVVLMLDGDEAGQQGTAEILPRLARRVFVRVVDLADGKQPDMLSSAEISSILGPVMV